MIFRNNTRRFLLLTLLLALALVSTLSFNSGISGASARTAVPPMPPPSGCTVVGWGADFFGQATSPAGLSGVTAVAAGALHSLALKSDGTVVGWGYSDGAGAETPPAGLSGVTAIAAGAVHSLALKSDGTVVAWGSDAFGQTTVPAGLSGVTAIAAGLFHSLALKSDGTVVGWGYNDYGQTTPPAGLSDVVAIAAGLYHNLALKSDGTVVGWGADISGQVTPPASLSGVVAVAAGLFHSLALKSDGTVVGWGDSFGTGAETPPAGLSGVTAIAAADDGAGGSYSLALKSDGTVVGWGSNAFGQATPPAGLSGVTAIAAGYFHSLAVADCASSNNPPVVTITGPSSGSIFAVGTPVNFTGTFTDTAGDTHTGNWMFDAITQAATIVEPSGSTPGSANTTYTFTQAGVYAVKLTVTDNGSLSGTDTTVGADNFDALVVIYDPSAGWVTGGGWINSPAGAYAANPSLTGKANFGFVSKYQNGNSVPTGNTEFHFKAGDLKFKSTVYEWMVISGGKKAQYKGLGTINGAGSYRFMLTAIDGDKPGGGGQDKFRIRIWSDSGGLVYDNQMNDPDSNDPTTVLGGGSIQIHH